MSKKFLKVNTLDATDAKDLFNAICTDILKRSPADVRKEDLKFKVGQSTIMKDVIDLCKMHKIETHITVIYEEGEEGQGSEEQGGVGKGFKGNTGEGNSAGPTGEKGPIGQVGSTEHEGANPPIGAEGSGGGLGEGPGAEGNTGSNGPQFTSVKPGDSPLD